MPPLKRMAGLLHIWDETRYLASQDLSGADFHPKRRERFLQVRFL